MIQSRFIPDVTIVELHTIISQHWAEKNKCFEKNRIQVLLLFWKILSGRKILEANFQANPNSKFSIWIEKRPPLKKKIWIWTKSFCAQLLEQNVNSIHSQKLKLWRMFPILWGFIIKCNRAVFSLRSSTYFSGHKNPVSSLRDLGSTKQNQPTHHFCQRLDFLMLAKMGNHLRYVGSIIVRWWRTYFFKIIPEES